MARYLRYFSAIRRHGRVSIHTAAPSSQVSRHAADPHRCRCLTNTMSGWTKPTLLGQPAASIIGGAPLMKFWGIRGEATVAENIETDKESGNNATTTAASETVGETHSYQAEVSRLLDLIVHSLYSHKEVFLRELVSNASDALDKLRFLSVTDSSLLGDHTELAIKIRADTDKGILIITDSGIGMTKDELVSSLGTIAQSGTANFVKALQENRDSIGDSNLIGKFGVGFYSAFLVSDKVSVSTKNPKSDKQYVWEAEANSNSFVVREETNPDYLLPRGTSIILHLKEEAKKEYTDTTVLQNLVKNYSQFISFPIYIGQERTRNVEVKDEATSQEGGQVKDGATTQEVGKEGEQKKTVTEKYYTYDIVNETKPIWLRSPKEVTKEEYHAFYKKTYDEHLEPMAYTHFNTEGEVEFKSLLYIPGMAPFGQEEVAKQKNIKLYVKRVFISDNFNSELLPRYLSFIKGVIDSNDLPLNVSREVLQESRIVHLMKRRLTKKSFDLFDSFAKSSNKEDYKKFWRHFGKYIKLGISEDRDNQKRLANFLRFYSSKHEENMTSLKQYVENMKKDQKSIYYFSSESVKSAKSAPFLEQLINKDYEVLFMTEPLDEVTAQHLKSFEGKKFVDISKEDFDLGENEEQKKLANEYSLLCDWMKEKLGERIAKVEVSKRLSSSPCALISGKHGWSANMERIMRAQNLGDTPGLKEYMRSTRILEINPNNSIIQDLDIARKAGKPGTNETVELLYETALLSSGFIPEDPAGFGRRIYDLMECIMGNEGGSSMGAPPKVEYHNTGRTKPVMEAEVLEPEVKSEGASV